ncbi:hypothetical protein STPH2_0004 [Streptomyces sp. KO7888]|nr:hypothetical protein [Streptomyces sp. KO7888]
MEPADLLDHHGVKPVGLEAAPAPPARRETLARIQETPPRSCAVCGDPAATARSVRFPGAGPRWVDLCWDDGMAVRPRGRVPETLGASPQTCGAAAREAGLPGASSLSFYSSFEVAARGRGTARKPDDRLMYRPRASRTHQRARVPATRSARAPRAGGRPTNTAPEPAPRCARTATLRQSSAGGGRCVPPDSD